MAVRAGNFRTRLFGISVAEATFARRGFYAGQAETRRRLEDVGRAFIFGYHTALGEGDMGTLADGLEGVEPEFRGFAYEGAGMALALLDTLTPWKRNRLQQFLAGPGAPHIYMVHVGTGWVLARLRRGAGHPPSGFDPLLGWLAIDGYGFHEGYFHWPNYIQGQPLPRRIRGYARRVFDQGLGRSLWFVSGADVGRVVTTVESFPVSRQPDLWSGVGLACAYAGGADRAGLATLWKAAGMHQPELAQGVAFAAKARQRAGNPALCTDLACAVFCQSSAHEVAAVTDWALGGLPSDALDPAYEVWRRRIQDYFAKEVAIL